MTKPPLPCKRCGGPKDGGIKGALYCPPCREEVIPVWQQAAHDRDKRKAAQQTAARPDNPARSAPEGEKWCNRCKRYLPHRKFTRTAKGASFSAYCRICQSEYNYALRIKKQFGITLDQYELLLESQGGRCAICQRLPRSVRFAVDHNHKTGVIRGLLCSPCNHKILGAAHEDAALLRRAADYLENPPAPAILTETAEAGR